MPLKDGSFTAGVIVTTDSDELQEISVVDNEQRITIYARWQDEALWIKSVKTGMSGADAWAITGEVTIDDPFYRTLNEYVVLSRLIAGYGEESVHGYATGRTGTDSTAIAGGLDSQTAAGDPRVSHRPST